MQCTPCATVPVPLGQLKPSTTWPIASCHLIMSHSFSLGRGYFPTLQRLLRVAFIRKACDPESLDARTSDPCSLWLPEAIEGDPRLPTLHCEVAENRGVLGARKLPMCAEQSSTLSGGVGGQWKAIWLPLHFPEGPPDRLLISSPVGLHFGHKVPVIRLKENAHHVTVPLSHPPPAMGWRPWLLVEA